MEAENLMFLNRKICLTHLTFYKITYFSWYLYILPSYLNFVSWYYYDNSPYQSVNTSYGENN